MDTSKILTDLERILGSYKNIGVMSSGGLDSSVLIFLLLKLSRELNTGNKIKIFTIPKVDGAKDHSLSIISYLNDTFDTELKQTTVGDLTLKHPALQTISGICSALNDLSLNILLTADTKVPDFEIIPGKRNPERTRGSFNRYDQPFFDYTKDYIVQLGIENGSDEIFRRSHSCIMLSQGRCNECWWCKEREWAFKQNNYTDPGVN